MSETEVSLNTLQNAFRESFEDGRLATTVDGAPSGKIRVIGNVDLPEPLVKSLLGDLYDGAVSDSPTRSARGSDFASKDGGAIGSEEVDFDKQ